MGDNVYTQEMHQAGYPPKVGMKCNVFNFEHQKDVESVVLSIIESKKGKFFVYENEYDVFGGFFSGLQVRPFKKKTDKEQAIDDLDYVLVCEVAGGSTRKIAEHIVNKIKGSEFEYLSFTGGNDE